MIETTLMVHMQIGRENLNLLRMAADLAQRMNARVIGIAACQPMQMVYGDGYLAGGFVEETQEKLELEMKEAESAFRWFLSPTVVKLEWRSTMLYSSIAAYIAREARGADIIVTSITGGKIFDAQRKINLGDLVMQAGRPVLILPENLDGITLDKVLIGWQDTPEVRRAILLALPVLKMARYVAIAEIATDSQLPEARLRIADVVAWLLCHGVVAEPLATLSQGNDQAQLQHIAEEQDAHIILAGAYGHSRVRELMFGGITKDLLYPIDRCSLLA